MAEHYVKIEDTEVQVGDRVYGRNTGNTYKVVAIKQDMHWNEDNKCIRTKLLQRGPDSKPGAELGGLAWQRPRILSWHKPSPGGADGAYPVATEETNQEEPSKEDTTMSNAYDIAADSVKEELERQAKARADKAVKQHLKPVQKLVRKAKVIMVTTSGGTETVFHCGNGSWRSGGSPCEADALVQHLVASIAEGGVVQEMVVKS